MLAHMLDEMRAQMFGEMFGGMFGKMRACCTEPIKCPTVLHGGAETLRGRVVLSG